MAKDRFLIAPFKSGLQNNVKPFLLPEDAFQQMDNVYIKDGVIKKRSSLGYTGYGATKKRFEHLNSRLKILFNRLTVAGGVGIGITSGAGGATGTLPTGRFRIGQKFTIGIEIFIITALGTPAVMTTTGGATTRTIDTDTGAYVFAGAAIDTQIYFYPDGNSGDIVTDATGHAEGSVPDLNIKPGQIFTIGDEIFTIPETGTPVTLLRTGPNVDACTFDTTTGEFYVDNAAKNSSILFYSCEPVMGLSLFEASDVNDRQGFAFDTRYSYRYSPGGYWIGIDTETNWNGDNTNYFYTTQYRGALSNTTNLITSNFKYIEGLAGTFDPIRYYSLTSSTWTDFTPKTVIVSGTQEHTIATAKIIVPFVNSLLFFGTVEQYEDTGVPSVTLTYHPSRCRWSGIGNALAPATAFLEPNQTGWSGGGYSDANTQEELISVKPLKDRLVVFFERSTYVLLYTRNPIDPFRWEKINTQYGSDKTYSSIAFDSNVLAIGQQGIIATNGNNVNKIDSKIPNFSFEVSKELESLNRVHGIRDLFDEIVYWNYIPQEDTGINTYPSKLLVYNYVNDSWSKFDETITVFGYLEQTDADIWKYDYQTWREDSSTWNDGIRSKNSRRTICGNQKGFIHYIYPDSNFNDAALYVTNLSCNDAVATDSVLIVTSESHNLKSGDFIEISSCSGVVFEEGVYKVNERIDADSFNIILRPKIDETYFSGEYIGGGLVARVSQIKIKSKEWNPYLKSGSGVNLSEINFYVTKEKLGQLTVDYSLNSSNISMLEDEKNLGMNPGANILELGAYELVPFESSQERVWHSLYFVGSGSFINIYITLTDDQMISYSKSGFELHGMLLLTDRNYGGL